MKLLKYFTAVVLTLASEGDQEPPGVALKNCRTELGFQINNSTDARSCAYLTKSPEIKLKTSLRNVPMHVLLRDVVIEK